MAKRKKSTKVTFVNREVSWLAFNERVLQEADDPNVPLVERVRFLGIFSNNRDEFFRVRVATVKRIATLNKSERMMMGEDAQDILDRIQNVYLRQEKAFRRIYRDLQKELKDHKIHMVDEKQLTPEQFEFVHDFFEDEVRSSLVPIMLDRKMKFPYLKDKAIYLAVKLSKKNKDVPPNYSIIEIPTDIHGRFKVLPSKGDQKYIIILDDVIRVGLKDIFRLFDYDKLEAYTLKMTRDAELDLDDDISESWIDKMEKSVKARKKGDPVRFVYDSNMPEDLLAYILKRLKLKKSENLIPGGRYHNFKDFMSFPRVGAKHLRYRNLPPLPHPDLEGQRSYLEVIAQKDVLLSYPYQSFDYVVDILREAAIDPTIESIQINLYRVAKESKVMNALINAVNNGKDVTVVIELQARFDEANNINWSNKLQEEGVKVIFGVQGLKVHSKLILITRKVGKSKKLFAHVGTGNFHEDTAEVYGDHSLLTCDPRITKEVEKVFQFFQFNYKRSMFRNLFVSPFNTRRKFIDLINQEIKNAKSGKEANISIKLNNLVDEVMIRKLYDASQAGVKIRMMIRGVCSLVPGVKGLSENIECYSVVDRFLEHARVITFCNDGDELYFISSADWMTRNLDHRVEVTTPVYDKSIQKQLKAMLDIQFADNIKARIIDKEQKNDYVSNDEPPVRSQVKLYKYFFKLAKPVMDEDERRSLAQILKS